MKKLLMMSMALLCFQGVNANIEKTKEEATYFDTAKSLAAWVVPSSVAEGYTQVCHLKKMVKKSSECARRSCINLPSTICSSLFVMGMGAADLYMMLCSTDPGVMDAIEDPVACANYYAENIDKLALKVGLPMASAIIVFGLNKLRKLELATMKS